MITMNPAGEIIEGGCVEVAGGDRPRGGQALKEGRPTEHLDLTGKLVVPGLINTHCHLSQQLARGLATTWTY